MYARTVQRKEDEKMEEEEEEEEEEKEKEKISPPLMSPTALTLCMCLAYLGITQHVCVFLTDMPLSNLYPFRRSECEAGAVRIGCGPHAR
jgi:hypothetical protein